jgi:RNA polymerase sigma factor (TIGR02999 family)
MSDVTRILSDIACGNARAAEILLPMVYDELRRLAAQRLTREAPGITLQPTALVHETYLRLVGSGDPGWDSRGHFFAAAAEAMRRILVENARRKGRLKRGGDRARRALDLTEVAAPEAEEDLLALDEALVRLAELDAAKAQLVQLRYFAGMTLPQAAEAMGISTATASRHWAFARAWLHREIVGDETDPGRSD